MLKDASCALKGKDVKAVVRQLFTRADNGTLVDPGPHGPTRKKVTADQLASFLTSYLNKWNPQTTAEQLAAFQSGKEGVLDRRHPGAHLALGDLPRLRLPPA